MGLGHVELAMVQAEAAKTRLGPWVLNCMAPDEGNMHTLLHWGTDEQKEKYLQPLCEGTAVVVLRHDRARGGRLGPDADPDPRGEGRRRVGHQRPQVVHLQRRAGRQFAILIARTELDVPEGSRGANTAFLVDLPADGLERRARGRDHARPAGHSEIVIEDLRVHDSQILGGRGNGHRLGQYRLGPARLAHCMRWIAQAETALDMMVDRSLQPVHPRHRSWPRSRASSG